MYKSLLVVSFFVFSGFSFSQSIQTGKDLDTTMHVVPKEKLSNDSKNKEKPVKDGYTKVYDKQRRLVQDGLFKKGKLFTGKKFVYGDNGEIIKVEIWKNGEYVEDGLLQE